MIVSQSVRNRRYTQQGVGIIEIMIALLVLTIGLLGMASMQTNGLNMTSESLVRSQAVFLANDVIERARTNRANLDDYSLDFDNIPDCETDFSLVALASVATNDINEWRNSVACLIPDGNAEIDVNADNEFVVTITWEDRQGIDNDGQVIVRSRL